MRFGWLVGRERGGERRESNERLVEEVERERRETKALTSSVEKNRLSLLSRSFSSFLARSLAADAAIHSRERGAICTAWRQREKERERD